MDMIEAMAGRHSVRSYIEKKIDAEIIRELNREIALCNEEGGLHIQLITDEPKAFTGMRAHYGKFRNVQNYITLVGTKAPDLHERIGYYGERVLLKATSLGLQSCWVAMTFNKGKSAGVIEKNEKLVCVLALGYGETEGVPHKNKPMEELYQVHGQVPEWFLLGMKGAMMAPTAMNQQKFLFTLQEDQVTAKTTGGFFSDVDLGIVKYHFELAAGVDNFRWSK